MRFFAIPLYDMILRYYLMMVVVLLAGFSGYYLLGILALPIFLSAILGVSFKPAPVKEEEMAAAPSSARVIELQAPAAAAEKVA